MTPQLISLIISLLAVLIVVIQVFVGMIRGLKKSVFRLIWIFAFGVICLLLSKVIANALITLDISFLNLSVNGQKVTTFIEYVQKTLEASNPEISQMMADNPKILELCVSIASSCVGLVVFEILFWLTKWLLWPIWAIFSAIFIKRKKKVVVDGKEKTIKLKKHAGFGALVGLGIGAVACMFAFMPVTFLNNAIVELERETTVEYDEGTQHGIITQFLGNNAEYVMVYENSTLNKVLRYSGLGLVQQGMGDIVTTSNVGGTTVSLKAELSNLTPVYVDYTKIVKYDFDNLSKADVAEILELADDMQKRVLSSGLLLSLYDEIAPYLAKNVLVNDNYFVKLPKLNNEELDKMMRDSIRAFFGYDDEMNFDATKLVSMSDIKNDISKLIDVVKELNKKDLVLDIKNNGVTLELLQEKVTVELSDKIVDDLFDLKTIKTLLPVVVEPGIKMGINALPEVDNNGTAVKVEYTAVDGGITEDDFKLFIKNTLSDAVEIMRGLDKNNVPYVDSDNFANVGAILNQFKTGEVISSATYTSLINYGKVYANNFVNGLGLDVNLKAVADDMISSIDGIGNFETELSKFGNAYKTYLQNNKEISILTVSKMLDNIKEAYLYTNNLNSIITNGTNFITNYITNNSLPIDTADLDVVVDSIRNVGSFETEYLKIKDLIDFVNDVVNTSSAEDLIQSDNLVSLGEKIDDAIEAGSILISDDNCKILIKNVLNNVTLPDDIKNLNVEVDGQTVPFVDALKLNVQNISSYKDEFEAVAKIQETKDLSLNSKEDFTKIGKILNEVKTTKLFGNLIKPIVSNMIDKKVDDFSVDDSIKPIIKNAKNNITDNTDYEKEFGLMFDFANADFDSISNFKTYLEANLINANGSSKSDIITTVVLYDIIIEMADNVAISEVDITSEIKAQIELDKQNGENILDVLGELDQISTEFDSIKTVPGLNEIDRTYLIELGQKVDNLDDNHPLVLNGDAVTKIGNYIAGEINNKVQTDVLTPLNRKQNVYATYQNKSNYASYEALFTKFADDLELA